MRLEPSSFLLFSLALLAAIVGAAPSRTKSWQQTSYYNNDENDPLKEPTSITVINHDDTPNGCVTEICNIALSPVTINGACKVKQTKKCRTEMGNMPCEEPSSGGVWSGCDSSDCGSSNSSGSADSGYGSPSGHTSSSEDSSPMTTHYLSSTISADISSMTQTSSDTYGSSIGSGYMSYGSMSTMTYYSSSSTISADISSMTQMSSGTSGSSVSSGATSTSSNTSASVASVTVSGTIAPAASVNGLSTVGTKATPTDSGSASATGSSSASSSSAGADSGASSSTATSAADSISSSTAASSASAAAANSTSQTAFALPGRKLSVLPIGLGVFAGISVIALIVVGLVTYERMKYRKAFRQRRLAESGGEMGYGGMAERT